MNKIPGWMTTTDLQVLGTLASLVPKNGNILEIGSFLGRSTKELFNNKDPSVSLTIIDSFDINKFKIDDALNYPFDGDKSLLINACNISQQENSWEAGFRFCLGVDICNNIKINAMSSKEFVVDKFYDMIFIDGDHSLDGVLHDINKFFHSDSILVGDDFNAKFPGVPTALGIHRKQTGRTILIPENSKIWISIPKSTNWKNKVLSNV